MGFLKKFPPFQWAAAVVMTVALLPYLARFAPVWFWEAFKYRKLLRVQPTWKCPVEGHTGRTLDGDCYDCIRKGR